MNELLAARYDEVVHRLAAGIEPIDGLSGARAGAAARVSLEYPRALAGAQPLAHAGGRWSIRYVPKLPSHADIRIADPTRRFVARRLRLPIVAEQKVRHGERAGTIVAAAERTWRPALFPGAAYAPSPSATGVRGRATHAGAPARWVRVEAAVSIGEAVLWRAHGDDRGEFLLLIGPNPHAAGALPPSIAIRIDVFGAPPPAGTAAGTTTDPYWDLPLEIVAPPGPDDPVSSGVALPPGYGAGGVMAGADVHLVPGRIHTDLIPFDLV